VSGLHVCIAPDSVGYAVGGAAVSSCSRSRSALLAPPADRLPEADDPGMIAAAAMTLYSIIKARPPKYGSPAQFFSRMRAGRLILQRVKTDVDGSQPNAATR
jgi:hypothetical protein